MLNDKFAATAFALGAMMLLHSGVANAESIKFNYTKTARQILSSHTSAVGDAAGHEIVQYVIRDTIGRSSGLELVDELMFEQDIAIAGTGTHRGFSVNGLRSGEKLYQRWEGNHQTTVKEGGDWEMTYSGKSQIIGGTGKYQNAKGWCNYKGRMTAASLAEDNDCSMEY